MSIAYLLPATILNLMDLIQTDITFPLQSLQLSGEADESVGHYTRLVSALIVNDRRLWKLRGTPHSDLWGQERLPEIRTLNRPQDKWTLAKQREGEEQSRKGDELFREAWHG